VNPTTDETSTGKVASSRDNVPANIRNIFDRLQIPESEKKYLAGVGGQYDSSVIYHKLKEKRAKS
jgi:Fe-S cluster assembly protein SufB